MDEITLLIGAMSIVVHPKKLNKATLAYRAPGLLIYTLGAIPIKRRPAVINIALNECISRNIPAKQLERVK